MKRLSIMFMLLIMMFYFAASSSFYDDDDVLVRRLAGEQRPASAAEHCPESPAVPWYKRGGGYNPVNWFSGTNPRCHDPANPAQSTHEDPVKGNPGAENPADTKPADAKLADERPVYTKHADELPAKKEPAAEDQAGEVHVVRQKRSRLRLRDIPSKFPAELVNLRATMESPYNPGDHSLFEAIPLADKKRIVEEAVLKSSRADRAVGTIVGMGIGDWVGHPLEFVDIRQAKQPLDTRPRFDLSELKWYRELNAFDLKRGQWTDDASMGLCMADSLIIKKRYDGSDIRTRFWNWLNRGYNNAFRKDQARPDRKSVGLGGNIGKLLLNMPAPVVPIESDGEDGGDGSLMRLAPIPVFFCKYIGWAKYFARESSFTTHPGYVAAEASAFMALIITRAIHYPWPADPARDGDVQAFLNSVVEIYDKEMDTSLKRLEAQSQENADRITAQRAIRQLLASAEPDTSKEYNWNWRIHPDEYSDCLVKTLENRGEEYNGREVKPKYFGADSMDGLAMALHSVYYSTSFADVIERCVNLLGDADTTGSICGQIAGSIYGFRNLFDHPQGKQMIEWMAEWDDYEFGLRGVLLYTMGDRWTPPLAAPKPANLGAHTKRTNV